MTQDRSIAAHIAVVDAATAPTEDSPAALGAAVALPAGYDRTDLQMLKWIAAHRDPARAKMSEIAA